jgi:hypothetical protein
MIKAAQISMGEGQSYENILIYTYDDMIREGIATPFESRSMAFRCGDCIYIIHVWNIICIKLDKIQRGGVGFDAERIVLSGDTNYYDIRILEQNNWINQGIPYILKTDDGITAQMVFSCSNGTFIILDQSVTSIIIKSPRPGITAATQIIDSSTAGIKKASKPNTIHGQIKR